ncbi:hypothetical protein TMatcc_003506, partial [Talaromyces marneffei ATCC 18224]
YKCALSILDARSVGQVDILGLTASELQPEAGTYSAFRRPKAGLKKLFLHSSILNSFAITLLESQFSFGFPAYRFVTFIYTRHQFPGPCAI